MSYNFNCRVGINTFKLPLLLLTSKRYGEWHLSRGNRPVGKEESIFVSATHNKSKFLSIISLKFSNLFLTELIFIYEKFMLEGFLFSSSWKTQLILLWSEKRILVGSDLFLCLWESQHTSFNNDLMLLANILVYFLFKCNSLLFKEDSLIKEFSTNMNRFREH